MLRKKIIFIQNQIDQSKSVRGDVKMMNVLKETKVDGAILEEVRQALDEGVGVQRKLQEHRREMSAIMGKPHTEHQDVEQMLHSLDTGGKEELDGTKESPKRIREERVSPAEAVGVVREDKGMQKRDRADAQSTLSIGVRKTKRKKEIAFEGLLKLKRKQSKEAEKQRVKKYMESIREKKKGWEDEECSETETEVKASPTQKMKEERITVQGLEKVELVESISKVNWGNMFAVHTRLSQENKGDDAKKKEKGTKKDNLNVGGDSSKGHKLKENLEVASEQMKSQTRDPVMTGTGDSNLIGKQDEKRENMIETNTQDDKINDEKNHSKKSKQKEEHSFDIWGSSSIGNMKKEL